MIGGKNIYGFGSHDRLCMVDDEDFMVDDGLVEDFKKDLADSFPYKTDLDSIASIEIGG